ncbi:MAG TPA: DUF3574 domain-containing protein [Stellaceae bacterium]|jgi:hypothetical protein|nr:DUF3574 domain-containing protein [Stellaceae bacterium]
MSTRRALLLASGLALAGCAAAPPPLCSPAETLAGCAVATELFFGLSRPDGTIIGEAEWQSFLAETVTPRFPAGFTILAAEGQWRQDDTATIVRESSRILLIVHRAGEDEAAIAALIDAYKTRFRQQSVLRLDVKSIARF